VRNNDRSILPEPGKSLRLRYLNEKEGIEISDALLENNSVTYLELGTAMYAKGSAEALANYVRTSKRLEHITWNGELYSLLQHEEMMCCLLPAIQESTSLKELHMELPPNEEFSYPAFATMLAHTQSLRSLTLTNPIGLPLKAIFVAAAEMGLNLNTTLRDLTLELSRDEMTVSPILTSLRDHPLLRRLFLRGWVADLTGLETVLLSHISNITDLDIDMKHVYGPLMGMTCVLQALGRHPVLTKLGIRNVRFGHDEVRLLGMALYNLSSLQT
jgi:hypothetical protein